MPVKIFFCYAHEDEALLNKLKAHLRTLEYEKLINVWYDRDISAGTNWEEEINTQLKEADIILLLISPDFMNSDYCIGKEMQRALERDKRGETRVIPIILRPVNWKGILGSLQALPTDGKAITSWSNQDEAFVNVTAGIKRVVENSIMPALPIKTDWQPQQFLPNSDTSQFEKEQRLFNQSHQSQNYQLDWKAQANLFIQPSNNVNQEWISPDTEIPVSNNVQIETLFNEAVIAQSNGNLEKALEFYQRIRKQNPNFKKAQLISKLKKLLEQLVTEANDQKDLERQTLYLKILLDLDPGDIIVQNRLEKVSLPYIQLLRKRATSAREASNWEAEYRALEELRIWRPQDIEVKKYWKPLKIKFLRQQARKARKAGLWDDEVRLWRELSDLQPTNAETKRRQAIASKNQDHSWIYENALLESERNLDKARETLEHLWHESPYYGDPKKLARKVGIFVPLPLEKWRRTTLLTLIASILVLLVIAISLGVLHIDSTIAWVGLIIVVVVLIALARYWLLLDWLN